jgi:hypothetical protein
MNDKMKRVMELAVSVVLSRGGDVDTEDGCKATIDTDEIIKLEAAIVDAFNLPSDDVVDDNINLVMTKLKSLKGELSMDDLLPALRQYKHIDENKGSEGFVFAYNKNKVKKILDNKFL